MKLYVASNLQSRPPPLALLLSLKQPCLADILYEHLAVKVWRKNNARRVSIGRFRLIRASHMCVVCLSSVFECRSGIRTSTLCYVRVTKIALKDLCLSPRNGEIWFIWIMLQQVELILPTHSTGKFQLMVQMCIYMYTKQYLQCCCNLYSSTCGSLYH